MPETITNARLNILWGEAFFEHLSGPSRALPDQPWLGADYRRIFGQLRGGAGNARFALPWRDGQRSSFWKAYCEQTPVSQISSEQAFRLLVPLRLTAAGRPTVKVTVGGERLFYDVYGFPHGLVATLTIQTVGGAQMSVEQWRDRMRELRMGPCLSLDLPGEPPRAGLRAQDVLEALVSWHREQYFGSIAAVAQSDRPFSIATVIQGSGVDPATPLANQPDLQRSLHAVAAWPVAWAAAALPPLSEASLETSSLNSSAGDALYAAGRGRVLWRPLLFTYPTNANHRLHSLSCLAHNLLAASVQAESLRLFAIRFAAVTPAERGAIPPVLRQLAALRLSCLWRGDQTYRSASVKRQLGDANSLAHLNMFLTAEGVPPIG